MAADHERTVRALFEEVADQPASVRDSVLAELCDGNERLLADLQALLDTLERAAAEGFLGRPTRGGVSADGVDGGDGVHVEHVEPATASLSHPTEDAGSVIGRYKLLQQIGEGGFGVVHMAEQTRPMQRTVALKIIKLGMDTKQVIARFEAERQALALMADPNIAPVLDAGSTETGRPYFVMELVKGVPITEYCDTHRLGTDARLGLFQDVCHAVQHAHQKGVIHRDLKPSNVMITLHDGKPVVKVIDFGIAKALHQKLTERTLFTEYRQLIGTPEYMSPEQAEMSGLDVDTRSDIYALGVLLYELLAGVRPFDAKRLREAGYGEIQRIIREEEPPKPSTRVSSAGRTPTPAEGESSIEAIAEQRHTDVRTLARSLRGDLDWIVMKCLEKDRARRYETANGLAADIGRHLRNEPVTASPPSLRYRLEKLVRRNRAVAATAAAIALVLVGATLVSTGFGISATRARSGLQDALDRESDQKREAVRLRDETLERNLELERIAYASEIRGVHELVRDGQFRGLADRLDALDSRHRGFEWTWLRTRVEPVIAHEIDTGGEAEVTVVELSPDGSRLLVARLDGVVQAYRTATWALEYELPSRGHEVRDAAFDPTGQRVAIVVPGRAVVLLDAATGTELHRTSSPCRTVAFAPDGSVIASVGDQWGLVLLDPDDLSERRRFERLPARAWSLHFSPTGTRLLASCFDGTARLLDPETGAVVEKLVHNTDAGEPSLGYATFSHDGRLVVTTGWRGRAKLWNAETGALLRELHPHLQRDNDAWSTWDADFSFDDRLVACCGNDGLVRVSNVETGAVECVLMVKDRVGMPKRVRRVRFDASATRVIAGGRHGRVHVWLLDEAAARLEMTGHTDGVLEMCATPDGAFAFSVGYDGTVRKWDLLTGRQIFMRQLEFHIDDNDFRSRHRTLSVDVTPDRSKVVVTTQGGRGYVLDAATGVLVQRFEMPPGSGDPTGDEARLGLMCVRVSPDGRTIAAGVGTWSIFRPVDRVAPIYLFDLGTGTRRRELAMGGHTASVSGVAFSPDGSQLFSTGFDGQLLRWDLVDPGPPDVLIGPSGSEVRYASDVVVDAASQVVIASYGSGEVSAHHLEDGTPAWSFQTHDAGINALSLSPDGTRLLTAGSYGYAGVTLWDMEGPTRLMTLGDDIAGMHSAVFAGNDRIVTSETSRWPKVYCYEMVPATGRFSQRMTVRREQATRRTRWESVASLLRRGNDAVDAGQLKEAIELFEEAHEIRLEHLGADHPRVLVDRAVLAGLLLRSGDHRRGAHLAGEALEMLLALEPDRNLAHPLNIAAWRVVVHGGLDANLYRLAREAAQRSVDLDAAGWINSLNTLGTAQYRVGGYREALQTLARSDAMTAADAGSDPGDWAFIAMAYHQLGQREEAAAALARLRDLMTLPANANDLECQAFLREAEALIDP
jgi:serine/threonine protein kinase/WD40 repeat protein